MSDEATETEVQDLPGHEDGAGGEQQTTTEEGQQQQQQTTTQEPPDLTKAMTDLANLVREGQKPKEQERAPTQDEINEFWAVYNPEAKNKEFFKHFFRLPDDATPEQIQQCKEIFADLQSGLMRQSITGAKNILSQELTKLREEFAPLREYYETAQREATRGRFYGEYPVLEDDKYQPVISAVAAQLNNKNFQDEKSYFKALAEGAAEHIKRLIPEFDLGAKPTKKTGTPPKLNRTSAGGGGGAGKGKEQEDVSTSSTKNDIDSLE